LNHKPHAGQLGLKSVGRPSGSYGVPQASSSKPESLKRPHQSGPPAALPLKPAPSNVLSRLATLNNQSKDVPPMDGITRSSAFAEKPAPQLNPDAAISTKKLDEIIDAPQRDDRLALIEDLEVGPTNHKAPFDDPHFQQMEPNSGIRLSWVAKRYVNLCSN
jgi:minichromosome maintenance protein 10